MSEPITDEIVDTAARAEWDQYKPDLDGGPWEDLTEAQRAAWREGVEVALAAAIPLITPAIKAQALREAADWLDDMARGQRETPYLSAGRDLIARLRARADEFKSAGRDLKSPAAIQANRPELEEPGDNSNLRDRIAEAINGGPLPEPSRDWETDMYQTQAAAVIAALGLEAQEIEHPKTVFLRRYVTPWKELP